MGKQEGKSKQGKGIDIFHRPKDLLIKNPGKNPEKTFILMLWFACKLWTKLS